MQRRDPMELNFEGLEMQKWNIPTDIIQRVDEKDGVICLVIIFTPRVIVIVRNSLYLVFSADDSKKLDSLRKIFKSALKVLLNSFRKCYN